jgi:4-alpha-glucanotransferase
MQDVIGLGSEARMNLPSEPGGNWRWRLQPGLLNGEIAAKLALLAEISDRLPQAIDVPPAEEFVA